MSAAANLAGAVVRPHPSGGFTLAVPAGGAAHNYVGNWATAWAAARWLALAVQKSRGPMSAPKAYFWMITAHGVSDEISCQFTGTEAEAQARADRLAEELGEDFCGPVILDRRGVWVGEVRG